MILSNSNPATIMTDPGLADVTYIEPITTRVGGLRKVVDSGGAREPHENGVLQAQAASSAWVCENSSVLPALRLPQFHGVDERIREAVLANPTKLVR